MVINEANGPHASSRSVTALSPSGCHYLHLKICFRNVALIWLKGQNLQAYDFLSSPAVRQPEEGTRATCVQRRTQ